MSEKRLSGGGFLRPSSSAGALKRSSSVEILVPANGHLLSRRPNTSAAHLADAITPTSTPSMTTSASLGTLQRSAENVQINGVNSEVVRKNEANDSVDNLVRGNKVNSVDNLSRGKGVAKGTGKGKKASEGDITQVKRRKQAIMNSAPSTPAPGEGDDEPMWQRRLSQLFIPPTEEELEPEKDSGETCLLLPRKAATPKLLRKQAPSLDHLPAPSKSPPNLTLDLSKGKAAGGKGTPTTSPHGSPEKERRAKKKTEGGKINFNVEKKDQDVEKGSNDSEFSSSSSSDDDEGNDDPTADDYMSWDDTICSNRSSYFKMYYSQRGVIGGSKTDDGKSKFSRASSHNSLSSLIRERMKPDSGKAKTRLDVGMMLLVVVLFIIIVVGISLITYFYNLHLLELSIFNCIKFYEQPRILEIYDPAWKPVVKAHLGSNLPNVSIPEDCTQYIRYLHKHNHSLYPYIDHDHNDYEDTICLDWTSLARLQLRKLPSQDSVQCYLVWWVATNPDFTLRDCLMVGGEQGAWWGGGEMSSGGYPVTKANIAPTHMVTGKLGRDSWGQVLRRTWVSQLSSMLKLPDTFKGRVSINHEDDGRICVESTRAEPPQLPMLRYTLCTAENMTEIARHLHREAMSMKKQVEQVEKPEVNDIQRDDHSVAALPENAKLISNAIPVSNNSINATEAIVPSVNITESDSFSNETESTNQINTVTSDTPLNVTEATEAKNTTEVENKKVFKVYSEEAKSRVLERIENPVYVPWMSPDNPELNQVSVIAYVEKLASLNYGYRGHILLPATWQTQPGYMTFDPIRFPDPEVMVQRIHELGFKLALSVHPFVSIDAPAFNNGTTLGLWVKQKESELPALAIYDNMYTSAVTDFSNPQAKRWFSSHLEALRQRYNISRFHLQPSNSHALPAFHQYHESIPGPDASLAHFLDAVSMVSPPLSTEAAVMPPPAPTFLTLGSVDGSWEGLDLIVPRILTLAMLGFPLVDIGVVGGLAVPGHRPDRELYIRWLQISAFLPATQMNVLPDKFGQEMTDLYTNFTKLREDVVMPRIKGRLPGALESGLPLITPLGLFSPDDSEAANVSDEWILGEDMLVAPITKRKERSRKIYLPAGIWKDEIDGRLWSGGRWIKDYKIPLTKIAYFTLKSLHQDDDS